MSFSEWIKAIDSFVWGPFMLILLMGTGVFLTIRTKFLPWRNLPYALKNTLSKEARQKGEGEGDVSPFSALTTALASTIGTGNIVGVATAMVSGGPGALVWMWISACFGLSSKFAECMLSIKHREVNQKGEMSGGPMYTMKNAFKHKRLGCILAWMFALFTIFASFGIGNMTQANSIASALNETFHIPVAVVGIVITILTLAIIVGGIQSISKVSTVVVPMMAVLYIIAGVIVIIGNIEHLPSGIAMIFSTAFSVKAVSGGALGTVVASMTSAMRYGIARGVFSNEAGMGSAAITAAAATTDSPVQQGYINMTGTFWDTIVVCTITGLVIASSGVLGVTEEKGIGTYQQKDKQIIIDASFGEEEKTLEYEVIINGNEVTLIDAKNQQISLTPYEAEKEKIASGVEAAEIVNGKIIGTWQGNDKNIYNFRADGSFSYDELVEGSSLTIYAFRTVMGSAGGWMIAISIALFAFSTILGWEYNGEKALEYILGTHKFNMIYRIFFSVIAYFGATQALELVWN